MSPRLLVAEAAILVVAAVVIWMIVAPPFGSSPEAGADDPLASDRVGDQGGGDIPYEDDSGDDTADDGDDSGDDPGAPPGDGCAPAVSADFMRGNQLLTFYGNPDAAQLGILGELPPDELVARLKQEAATYDGLNGFRGVQPGLHLVYATAQNYEGEDGLYVRRVDRETLEEYIDLACRNQLFIFLDLQLGRADLETEIEKLRPYLQQTHVHLSLDPEFAMGPDEVPGEHLGHLDASQINRAQQMLDELIQEHNLGDKILIVHQFQDEMITNKDAIEDYTHVRLVIDMDGFGEPATKLAKFQLYAAPAEYGGIKIFYKQDHPLLSESEILKVRPDLIIYQ
jgi:hypothetical protein